MYTLLAKHRFKTEIASSDGQATIENSYEPFDVRDRTQPATQLSAFPFRANRQDTNAS
jgi:hypothetical protein